MTEKANIASGRSQPKSGRGEVASLLVAMSPLLRSLLRATFPFFVNHFLGESVYARFGF